MSDWIQALGPRAAYDSEAQALKGARWTAIALGITAAVGAVQAWHITRRGPEIIEAMRATAAGQAQTPEMAAAADAMLGQGTVDMMIMTGAGMAALALLLGLFQWFRPNRVIPLICLLLAVYGVVSGLVGALMAGASGLTATQGIEPWSQYLGYGSLVVTLFMHIAGLRGASALKRLRD